jgi:hypothetical protein
MRVFQGLEVVLAYARLFSVSFACSFERVCGPRRSMGVQTPTMHTAPKAYVLALSNAPLHVFLFKYQLALTLNLLDISGLL